MMKSIQSTNDKFNMIYTVTEAKPVTANPKRTGTLSWKRALRGSQTAQQNQIKIDVATNSMQHAFNADTSGCGVVTPNDGPDCSIIPAGVSTNSVPKPINAPTSCAMK